MDGYHRLAQAVLVRALKEAPTSAEARRWLVCRPNRLRTLIIDEATNLHQDDLDRYVRELSDGTTEA